eukprot:312174-Prymnesium_polylepis.1
MALRPRAVAPPHTPDGDAHHATGPASPPVSKCERGETPRNDVVKATGAVTHAHRHPHPRPPTPRRCARL